MTEAVAPAAAPAAPAPAPAAPAPAPAAPAAPAPAPAAPSPAPAPAPASESLLTKPSEAAAPAGAPAPAPAADEMAWLPEKYRVLNDKGELDLAASSKKLGEGYGNLSKKLGTGEAPPESPDAYVVTTPEAFKDIPLDEGLSKSFRDRMHKVGLNQAQFDAVMGEYYQLVPQVLDAAAKFTAAEARTELSKVWQTPAELEAGVNAAQRAMGSVPKEMGDAVWEKFGRDPDFIQFAASFGKEMAEDRSINNAGGGTVDNIATLQASPAYRDAKHPDHAKVSEQVRKHFEAKYGTAPSLQ